MNHKSTLKWFMSKDESIGKHGYIDNLILWKYKKYGKYHKISMDILPKISINNKLFKNYKTLKRISKNDK